MPTGERTGRVRSMVDFYLKAMAVSASKEFQYRASSILLLAAMVLEAVIYLALWQAVAIGRGGEIEGWTVHDIAAYFVVWTLVRNMGTTFPPYGFEERIRYGRFTTLLLRPIHPIHYDLAEFAGWKFVMFTLWLPVALVMSLVFRPALDVTAAEVATFAVAVWGAFLIRSLYLWLAGLITFWTTRATGLFDLLFALELLMSGRLVPMQFLPDWLRATTEWLPFSWAFGFPIETLVGSYSTGQLVGGLLMQALWIGLGSAAVAITWRFAVRRYSAVGD